MNIGKFFASLFRWTTFVALVLPAFAVHAADPLPDYMLKPRPDLLFVLDEARVPSVSQVISLTR